ncbi:hypothetical protein XELAEV_18015764mg [Xenopus laevis]|uniref:Uncharacterized protein n=1 Tax=Xenopus laevis TaxID=8355 RepID=A0A974HWH0_XENLA|nr:hypothetical protein XELAEV_18015764mg [Xenopus laevis]
MAFLVKQKTICDHISDSLVCEDEKNLCFCGYSYIATDSVNTKESSGCEKIPDGPTLYTPLARMMDDKFLLDGVPPCSLYLTPQEKN